MLKWIKISEQLPPEDIDILGWKRYWGHSIYRYLGKDEKGNHKWISSCANCNYPRVDFEDFYPTWWCLVSKPPGHDHE